MTERENMELCWNHEQPLWVPMINTAAQMIISPEINDRPLFMSGKDDFGLEWELDPNHPELMTHVKPGGEMFDGGFRHLPQLQGQELGSRGDAHQGDVGQEGRAAGLFCGQHGCV